MTSARDASNDRFRTLPEPVSMDALVTTHDQGPVPSPKADRDTETDFLLRHAGG
jgi:hypothetical protein